MENPDRVSVDVAQEFSCVEFWKAEQVSPHSPQITQPQHIMLWHMQTNAPTNVATVALFWWAPETPPQGPWRQRRISHQIHHRELEDYVDVPWWEVMGSQNRVGDYTQDNSVEFSRNHLLAIDDCMCPVGSYILSACFYFDHVWWYPTLIDRFWHWADTSCIAIHSWTPSYMSKASDKL